MSIEPSNGILRVALTEPAYQGFDPQASYTQAQFEVLRCCLVRTLMSYRGVEDFPGTQPVPDLATGPPSVSSDGKTWTFHLKHGIHYAPPLEDVEVTAGDVVRALIRAGLPALSGGPGPGYLGLVQGFSEYAHGKADAIAGISTPDRYTVQVKESRADRSIEHVFAMPFTAPIPPMPGDSSDVLGTASGHPFASDFQGPPDAPGYGPFLVATGPYMIEGAQHLDFSAPPATQVPVSGFSPGWLFDDPGTLTLVRNPSWEASSDTIRPARAARIEISIVPAADPYPQLETGSVDVIMGENPAAAVQRRYQRSETLRQRITETTGGSSRFITLNVAQPPVDDVHVRRAISLVLDRRALATSVGEPTTSHLIPDPLLGSLLSSWTPFPPASDSGDLAAARAEMSKSRYGTGGRCTDPACRSVVVGVFQAEHHPLAPTIRAGLQSIGIRPVFRQVDCADPRERQALCATGWFADFPSAGNMVIPFVASEEGYNPSHLGSSARQLAQWGYATQHVPTIDSDYGRCAALSGVQAALCWARLDQLLTSELAALIPISSGNVVRLRGAGVSAYSLDQAFGEPSLDRISVKP